VGRQTNAVNALKVLLDRDEILIMPCCYDAFSAKLIEQADFPLTFMSGFSVAASRLGMPDTGLISYEEMIDQGRHICSAVDIPVFGDADTGYGNTLNIKRTVEGYIQTGFAGIMIEDQVSPKRCGHTQGKEVIDRAKAIQRLSAAIEAREEARSNGDDIVIIARTDARATLGLEEAIERALIFGELGADVLFVEAPQSVGELETIGRQIEGIKMANLVEHGSTPLVSPGVLQQMGFKIAAYPLTLLSSAAYAMLNALATLKQGQSPAQILDFKHLQAILGFPEYDAALERLEPETP
jgi:2-methylisocitrate lyase-like PEP mutase family enzyme